MKTVPSYKLVQNNTPTAAKAPYYGMIIPVGSLATGDILGSVVNGSFVTEETAAYVLRAFYEYCAETIAADVVRISTGTVSVYPMISGSFDTEDAAFDPTRNTLYVGASFSQDERDAVSAIEPTWGGEETLGAVRLDSEMDIATQTFKTICGTDVFRLAGRNLTVPDGADESIGLYSRDGLTKVMDVDVSENDGGQRLTCSLRGDAALAKGTYKLILVERGLDPTAALATLPLTVTLARAIPAPNTVEPGPARGSIVGAGGKIVWDGSFTVTGTGLYSEATHPEGASYVSSTKGVLTTDAVDEEFDLDDAVYAGSGTQVSFTTIALPTELKQKSGTLKVKFVTKTPQPDGTLSEDTVYSESCAVEPYVAKTSDGSVKVKMVSATEPVTFTDPVTFSGEGLNFTGSLGPGNASMMVGADAYELKIDSQSEAFLTINGFNSGANPPKGSYEAVIRLGCLITGGTVENLDFPVQVSIA